MPPSVGRGDDPPPDVAHRPAVGVEEVQAQVPSRDPVHQLDVVLVELHAHVVGAVDVPGQDGGLSGGGHGGRDGLPDVARQVVDRGAELGRVRMPPGDREGLTYD